MFACTCVVISVCVCACVLLCTCVCTCACACLLVCTYVRGHVYACICLQSHWIGVYRCASMHVFVYMHVQAGADDYMYLYANIFTHACMTVCACLSIYASTFILPTPPPTPRPLCTQEVLHVRRFAYACVFACTCACG